MGRDLDERQGRITLALYGGVFAALGFIVVALLFYLQLVLPLLGQLTALQADPAIGGGGATISDPAGDPALPGTAIAGDGGGSTPPAPLPAAAEPATPQTQFLLLLAATLPGAAPVGWALCASWRRGLLLAVAAHLILAASAVVGIASLSDGVAFILPLYLLPAALVPLLLLPSRITPALLSPVLLALLGILAVARFGWWAVPLAWVVLPIAGAIVAARADGVGAA